MRSIRPQLWTWTILLSLAITGCGSVDETADSSTGSTAASLSAAASDWNVLLLSIDTLRADRLGSYGYSVRDTSPRVDRLASSGVRFAGAQASRALTWPSLASVLTGLYPSGHGVVVNGYDLPDDLLTLPKLLQASGYQTGAVLSNMCSANHQGWESFSCASTNDGKASRQAADFLANLDAERPFFLWVHYFGPHGPYFNGGKFIGEIADPDYDGPVAARKGKLNRIMTESIELRPEDISHLDALYDSAVMGTDEQVDFLLEQLAATGRLDRTIIVFLADHGEDLYDHHKYLYHACSVYQTGLHVPLVFVAGDLLQPGTEVNDAVELIDVAPTLLDLLGVSAPGGLHGRSLLPYLEGREGSFRPRPAFSEYSKSRIHTVIDGNWKLVDNPDEVHPYCFENAPKDLYALERVELYDLVADPQELTNLAAENPEIVSRLQALLERRFASLEDRSQEQEVPDELKEELRALGYIAQ